MNPPDGERIVKLETQMEDLIKVVGRIESKIDSLGVLIANSYCTKIELNEVKRESIERFNEARDIATKKLWVASILTGLFTTVITILVTQIITNALK